MSDPAIGIGHLVSDPPRRPAHVPLMCAPQPRDLMVRYSRFSIRHTDFGIRNSRIGNRGTAISPCHERLPLDEVDHGAVGSPHRRMERW
jgi:hypothetical protein